MERSVELERLERSDSSTLPTTVLTTSPRRFAPRPPPLPQSKNVPTDLLASHKREKQRFRRNFQTPTDEKNFKKFIRDFEDLIQSKASSVTYIMPGGASSNVKMFKNQAYQALGLKYGFSDEVRPSEERSDETAKLSLVTKTARARI